MFQDPNLPPGCTSAMCEPYDPTCAMCGHFWSAHYDDEEGIWFPNDRKSEYECYGVERDSEGNIVHACDALVNTKTREQCECVKFIEGEYGGDEYYED